MTRNRIALAACAALLVAGAGGTLALAQGSDSESAEQALMLNAKTTLNQAIAAAVQQTGGRALSAGLNDENGKKSIAVEVVANGTPSMVLVDPDSGRVIGIAADPHENAHENEEAD